MLCINMRERRRADTLPTQDDILPRKKSIFNPKRNLSLVCGLFVLVLLLFQLGLGTILVFPVGFDHLLLLQVF
jgi:hypothetical protein